MEYSVLREIDDNLEKRKQMIQLCLFTIYCLVKTCPNTIKNLKVNITSEMLHEFTTLNKIEVSNEYWKILDQMIENTFRFTHNCLSINQVHLDKKYQPQISDF